MRTRGVGLSQSQSRAWLVNHRTAILAHYLSLLAHSALISAHQLSLSATDGAERRTREPIANQGSDRMVCPSSFRPGGSFGIGILFGTLGHFDKAPVSFNFGRSSAAAHFSAAFEEPPGWHFPDWQKYKNHRHYTLIGRSHTLCLLRNHSQWNFFLSGGRCRGSGDR